MSLDAENTPYAATELVPTTTLGPFTITLVAVLIMLTCFILNCNRIRRQVHNRRLDRFLKKQKMAGISKHTTEKQHETGKAHQTIHFDPCSSTLSASCWSSSSTLTAQSVYNPKEPDSFRDKYAQELVSQPQLVRLSSDHYHSTKMLVSPIHFESPVQMDWHHWEKRDEETGSYHPCRALPPDVQKTSHERDMTCQGFHFTPSIYYTY